MDDLKKRLRRLLAFILLILFVLVGVRIAYNKIIGVPFGLFIKLPLSISTELELMAENRDFSYRDRYYAYLYQYPDSCIEEVKSFVYDETSWNILPAEEEYEELLRLCFEWPYQGTEFLKELDLSSEQLRGSWLYGGRMNQLRSYSKQYMDYYLSGTHELVVNLENSNTLIYVWLHQ